MNSNNNKANNEANRRKNDGADVMLQNTERTATRFMIATVLKRRMQDRKNDGDHKNDERNYGDNPFYIVISHMPSLLSHVIKNVKLISYA